MILAEGVGEVLKIKLFLVAESSKELNRLGEQSSKPDVRKSRRPNRIHLRILQIFTVVEFFIFFLLKKLGAIGVKFILSTVFLNGKKASSGIPKDLF